MPTYTGAQYARMALRRLGVLDPIEQGDPEEIANALLVGTNVLDSLRNESLMVSGVTRSVYSLTNGTQAYSIGTGGTFNQDYPEAILRWSSIPDGGATDPNERERGRPMRDEEWQGINIKTQEGPEPRYMWYDRKWVAGLGRCHFWPVPDNSDVDVVLYQHIPEITSLVSGTQYNLRPGYSLLIETALAMELASGGTYEIDQDVLTRVMAAYARAKASVMRKNYVPRQAKTGREWAIGNAGRGDRDIYSDE